MSAGAALLKPRHGQQRSCQAGRLERRQSRIEAEPRRAIGTEDRVCRAHIDVDVRVVLRWDSPMHMNSVTPMQISGTPVVPELRIAVAGHRLTPL